MIQVTILFSPLYQFSVIIDVMKHNEVLLDIPLNDIDKDVTVKQLLNHTSGVPDYFDESVMDEYEELWIDYPNYKIRHNSDLLPLFINNSYFAHRL